MKCPRCNGRKCEPDNSGSLVWRACKMCHGSGIVPDNNENWFCSISTEEKANFFAKQCADSVADFKVGDMSKWKSENWMKWLKGEHE